MDYRIDKRDWSDWLLGVCVVGGLLAIGALAVESMGRAAKPPGESATTTPAAEVATQVDPVPLTTLRPDVTSPAVPTRPGVIRVYECQRDGYKFVSDRPCGPDAVEREVDLRQLNTYTEAPLPPARSPATRPRSVGGGAAPLAPAASAGAPSSSSSERSRRQQCDALQAHIDRINARMREGYTSQEGEYLRERWHKAKNAYYEADCGQP